MEVQQSCCHPKVKAPISKLIIATLVAQTDSWHGKGLKKEWKSYFIWYYSLHCCYTTTVNHHAYNMQDVLYLELSNVSSTLHPSVLWPSWANCSNSHFVCSWVVKCKGIKCCCFFLPQSLVEQKIVWDIRSQFFPIYSNTQEELEWHDGKIASMLLRRQHSSC